MGQSSVVHKVLPSFLTPMMIPAWLSVWFFRWLDFKLLKSIKGARTRSQSWAIVDLIAYEMLWLRRETGRAVPECWCVDVAVMRQEEHCFKGVSKWVYFVEIKSGKARESPANCVFVLRTDRLPLIYLRKSEETWISVQPRSTEKMTSVLIFISLYFSFSLSIFFFAASSPSCMHKWHGHNVFV